MDWRAGTAGTVIAVLLAVAPVRADVVSVIGKPPTVDVRITALREGQLEYRVSGDRLVSKPIEEIDYLQITNWPLFSLAEKQQRDGHFRQAISNYERMLAQLARETRKPPDEIDRKLLLQWRLLRALDQQGQFDRAVEVYLDIIEQQPKLAERIRPTKIPAAGSTFLKSATDLLNAAIRRHQSDAVAGSLSRWWNSWPREVAEPPASQPAATIAIRPGLIWNTPQEALREIENLVNNKQYDAAVQSIDSLLKQKPASAGAELFACQAQALLGRAGDKNTPEAQADRRRAGLALMRVVIHFPGHALAPECLYHAGEICVQSGQTEQAVGLWSELVRAYPTATRWVEQSRKALEAQKKRQAGG